MIVEPVRERGIDGLTLLDIGGGVGSIQIALLKSGIRHVTAVDASSSLLLAAREEATREGVADRVRYVHGDFIDLAQDLGEFDVVTLDRVICCYHDMPALVTASAKCARKLYALVYPRDAGWIRMTVATHNFWLRLRGSPMQTFVHPTAIVDGHVRQQGFRLDMQRTTIFWQAVVYRRTSEGA